MSPPKAHTRDLIAVAKGFEKAASEMAAAAAANGTDGRTGNWAN